MIVEEEKTISLTLSICMIVKNEENNLKRALESLKPLITDNFGELIIVDTGSTDSTVEIAKQYTNKVYQIKWNGFADARNKSISYAKGKWIFIFDADHEIPYESCINLRQMLNEPKVNKFNTISIEVRDYKSGSTSYNIFSQTLIFKNDGEFHYKGKIHNIPIFKYPLVKTSEVYIYHHGYKDQKILIKKIKERTLPELLKEYKNDPNSMHALLHLTQAYSILKQPEKAVFYGEKHRKLLLKFYPKIHEGNYAIYSYLGLAYYELDKRIRLFETMNEALKLNPHHLDASFMLCELFLTKEKDIIYAKKYLESSIRLYKEIKSKQLHKYSDFEFVSWGSAPHFFYELARIYDFEGNKEEAQKLLKEIIENIDSEYEASYYSIIIYYLNNKNISNLIEWFDKYWKKIKNKNLTMLDMLRTRIIGLLKEINRNKSNIKSIDIIKLFFIYTKTLEYDINKRYGIQNLEDYEKLLLESPNDIYPEWIATILITKYYKKSMTKKLLKMIKFLIGKDKDMDRILKLILLDLKRKEE